MRRRKFLIASGSLAATGAAALGTGAFDQVQAEGRTVSVNVADDSNALLGLDPSVGQYSELASTDGNGRITVNVSNINSFSGAAGVNPDASTYLFDIFKVRNQGKDSALVYVDPNSVEPSGVTDSNTGDYIDPQATQRPNGGDNTSKGPVGYDTVSLTGVYIPPSDPPSFANEIDSLFTGGRDNLILDPGQEFAFGLYIKEGFNDGDSSFPDVSMTFKGDTSVA